MNHAVNMDCLDGEIGPSPISIKTTEVPPNGGA
jgi:hypothetical protein